METIHQKWVSMFMRDFLVDLVNHRFVITLFVLLLIVSGLLLFRDGIQPTDLIVMGGIAVGWFVIWRILSTRSTAEITSVQAFQDALRNGQQPSLVEFYSAYCVGCMAARPIVDQLELEAGARLQIIKLNIDTEPGRSLVDRYSVLFTPTFIYFDRFGNKVRDSVLVLDSARILYELEHS
jgi:thiol-disulfide isomerase/thioredoxin